MRFCDMSNPLETNDKQEKIDAEIEKLGKYIKASIATNAQIRELSIYNKPSEESINRILNSDLPKVGRDPLIVADELVKDVFNQAMIVQHPRYFSFVPSAVSPYSIVGSILSDIYNINAGGWELAPCAAAIEERLVKFMASCAGYTTNEAGGVFLSGGSIANMSAMVAARDNKLKPEEFSLGTIYLSNQAHISNEKGLKIIGFRKDQIKIIPTDENFKIRTDLLENEIIKDIKAGKKPFTIIGTLGTTNTGSIDPLDKLGAIAKKYNTWFHVDGAFGASILLSKKHRSLAKGIELSDSFSWDSHKWLMQVYSCSTLIVKNRNTLLNAFAEHPEYLEDVMALDHHDSWNIGPEMSRPARAIKLWFTLQATGTDYFEDLINKSFSYAELIRSELEKKKNWRIISEPSCATINFRYEKEGLNEKETDEFNIRISNKINKSGYAYIVTTTLNGLRTLRMCTINANTTKEDILNTLNLMDEIATSIDL